MLFLLINKLFFLNSSCTGKITLESVLLCARASLEGAAAISVLQGLM